MKLYEVFQSSKLKAWFGNSVVVDKNNDPLIVFHGTSRDFDTTSSSIFWAAEDPELASMYAEARPYIDHKLPYDSTSEKIQGANVMPVFLKIENPLCGDSLSMPDSKSTATIDSFIDGVSQQAKINSKQLENVRTQLKRGRIQEESGPYYDVHDFWYDPDSSFGNGSGKLLLNLIKTLGFDGIKFTESQSGGSSITWGAFYPNQVKSAIGNLGSFDRNNPSIVEHFLKY